jgi:hypothetical protein
MITIMTKNQPMKAYIASRDQTVADLTMIVLLVLIAIDMAFAGNKRV